MSQPARFWVESQSDKLFSAAKRSKHEFGEEKRKEKKMAKKTDDVLMNMTGDRYVRVGGRGEGGGRRQASRQL